MFDNEINVENTGERVGDEIVAHCLFCDTKVYQRIMSQVRFDEMQQECDEYDKSLSGVHYWEEIMLLQCRGCRRVSFYREKYFSEYDGLYEIEQYPSVKAEVRPPLMADSVLPEKVQRIYDESINALNGGMLVLAGVGVRAIVETVCRESGADGDNLANRIDSLVPKGLVTKDGASILHNLRFMGNSSAHEVKAHSLEELKAAFDVVDHLLQGVYIIPEKAKQLSKKHT